MSLHNGQSGWSTPAAHLTNDARLLPHHGDDGPSRALTGTPPVNGGGDNPLAPVPEASDPEEDQRRARFADLYRKSDAKLQVLFREDGSYDWDAIDELDRRRVAAVASLLPPPTDHTPAQEPPRKKLRRTIDEDDYDDDDDEEDEDEDAVDEVGAAPPLPHKAKTSAAGALLSPSKSGSSPVQSVTSPGKQADKTKDGGEGSQSGQATNKSSEDARKMLEEARTATEEEVRRSFHTRFYTLEHDRTAMLEQQQLEESEKQLQAEMDNSHHVGGGSGVGAACADPGNNQGSLSSANLGASSLTLKHLIARIDLKRDRVPATDADLRLLMNEVRKNRSKWASEDNVNQEELYEAFEKVLTELKAHTEYSTPFLTRVNKRDAPDYYSFIKQPMDLGSMTKKLKGLNYKSKTDFVMDLNLIWDNCLKYNQDMNHPLRRMANGMRKEAEKLIPLIPDLAIRTRAEVEAEERRKQNGGDDDGGDDSDDEPIMSSRGRKAGAKGGTKSRKAPTDKEGTPSMEIKPHLQINGLLAKGREGSETVDSNGFATPPVAGSKTPSGLNGQSVMGSTADAMDIDGPSLNGMALNQALGEAAEQAYEDEEYKIWKQATKKDRARVARERFQLFKDNALNLDAPAILRTRGAMRRFLKAQKQYEADGMATISELDGPGNASKQQHPQETLAEEMEEEEAERVIPDYYEPTGIIPSILPNLRWVEDNEGQVINNNEASLQVVRREYFRSPTSKLAKNIDSNIRQIQETRKLATKIAVVKQMQLQAQVYANQFPRSNFEHFIEHDVEEHFISDGGPVMAPQTCHGALKRAVGKVLYHTGFEELQPAALDTLTSLAGDYFEKLVRTFTVYNEAEKKVGTGTEARFQPRFTPEEVLIHTLEENGSDVVALENYAKDEVGRLGTKLLTIHDRMRMHLADLLRPALSSEAGADGAGAFNDGSEQFVSGDFAEELGEDFFGFRNLGLERELGLDTLAVPLHLLQARVRSQFQQTQTPGVTAENLFESLDPSEPVTKENIQSEVGLVKNFFLAKLHANGDQPLVEDEDLPVKQRRPRPRLQGTGKIVAPPKRPPKEQIAMARRKKKLEAQAQAADKLNASPEKGGGGAGSANTTPVKKGAAAAATKSNNPAPPHQPNGLTGGGSGRPNPAQIALGEASMERSGSMQSQGNASQTDKDEANGMMSPESLDKLDD